MIAHPEIALATAGDAPRIALLSRDHIEQGLRWRWTPPRVLRMVQDADSNVVVARSAGAFAGFGIMRYKENEEAHLLLLAVAPEWRRKGVGSALVSWLETTALTAGLGVVYLEARTRNVGARAFYRALDYVETRQVPGLYADGEDGVRIAKDLWREG